MTSLNIKPTLAFLAVAALTMSACMKKFDGSSYAPQKPYGGYLSSSEIAPANLVAYWNFNGNLIDSVSKIAGVNTGTTFDAAGKKGQALKGADSSYVISDASNAVQNLNSFSLAFWTNIPKMPDGALGLFDLADTSTFWGNLDVYIDGGIAPDTAKFSVHVNNAGKDAWFVGNKVPGAFGKWVHYAVTYDAGSSTFTLYVNGTQLANKAQAGFGPLKFQNAAKLVFGTLQFQTRPSLTSATTGQPWARYLIGSMDEVRIYNRALTAAEVSSLVKLENAGR